MEDPEEPPVRILRRNLAEVDLGILPHLPERKALSRIMNRHRQSALPPNPSLADLTELAQEFTITNRGKRFLSYNNLQGDNENKILVFATTEDLCQLGRCDIFVQLYTIHGFYKENALLVL